jgi:membrane associated rhomboid family serine protease
MQISLTVLLCLATGIVSWQALSNSELFSKLSLSPYRVKHNKEIYRIWSHTLVHADMGHLFFNLFALFSFGRAVEHYMPTALFALLYLGAAAFATLPALKKHGDNIYYTSVGASGAVSAVMMLYMFMFPTSKLLFFFILPLPGWAAIILFFGLEYYMNKKMNTAIAHDAHLAGAAFGIAFLLVWKPQEFLDFFVVVFHSIAG